MGRRSVTVRAALAAVALGGSCALAWAGDDPPPPPPPAPVTGESPEAPPPPPPPAAEAPARADEPPAEPPKEAAPEAPKAEETPKETPPAEPPKPEPPYVAPEATTLCMPPPPDCWHGSVAVRYRGRRTASDEDHDLYTYLTLRWRNETANGASASFFGRLGYDIDGNQDNDGFYVFDSIDDTFGRSVTGRLYHAWVNFHADGEEVENLRVGRQWSDAGDGFLFDGAHFTVNPMASACDFRITAFGGVPAHLYEDSPRGDWIAGLGVSGTPWSGAEARVDVVHVQDENEYYGTPDATLTYAEIRQKVSNACWGRLWYSQLDDEPRLWGASFDGYAVPADASFRARFQSQMLSEHQTIYDIDPYYAIVETLEPYWDLHVAASKGFGRLTVEVGGDVRRLWDADDEGEFNREFERGYVTFSTADWPTCGLGLYLTGEVWDANGNESQDIAGGFDWRPSKCWRVSAGTDYALYRTNLHDESERLDSRAWYLRVVHTPSEAWRFDLTARYESDDYDDYWTFQVGVRRSF